MIEMTQEEFKVRHTGMRYDVVERTAWYSYGSNPYHFDYVAAASFLLRSDAQAFINCREDMPLGEFLLIDTVEGKIL